MISPRFATGIFVFLAGFFTITGAAEGPPFSAFVLNTKGIGINITVAVNVPATNSNNDLYFHMSGPNGQDWLAFGFGASMSDSPLIFVAYRNAAGTNLTVSPRIARGHSQPKHDLASDVKVTLLEGSKIEVGDTGSIIVNAKCENCRSWSGNSVDVKNPSQPMILASYDTGDDDEKVLKSDDKSADIKRHADAAHFQFTMNMIQATGEAGVPIGPFDGSSTENEDTTEEDGHLTIVFHALMMLGSFVLLYPMGIVWLRIFGKVWMHWINQAFATLCIVIAAVLGIVISVKYKVQSDFKSAHQIVGLIAVAFVLIQLSLGSLHHAKYRRTATPTIFGKIHRYFGSVVVAIGLANGFIGFNFAHDNKYQIPYGLLIVIVTLAVGTLLLIKQRRQRRKEAMTSTAAGNFNAAYVPNGFGSGFGNNDIPLSQNPGGSYEHGRAPPAYGPGPEGYGQGMPPAQRYV